MSAATLLSWALCGLVVGLIASYLVPGRRRMGLLTTTALGVVGAIAGGFVHWYLMTPSGEPFSLSGDAWQGWVAAVLGAMLAVWVYGVLHPRKWWQRSSL